MRLVVTGCAGFIGSNLVDRLLNDGHEVVGLDNLSTGQSEFLEPAKQSPHFQFVQVDLLEINGLEDLVRGAELVFHMAANADVRFGTDHPRRDLEQNTIVTHNVLEAMRRAGSRRIAFASTGSVYGEPSVFPTPECCPFPIQTSLYAASKLAAEGLVAAYSTGFGMQSFIFRCVSILGERYSHGHVLDFYRKLLEDPCQIDVLGDGHQRKSYLYVHDCVDAMLLAVERANDSVNIFNLGTDEYCAVEESLGWICAELGLDPVRRYAGGERGWIGDSPFIFLDCSKARALGWQPKLTIRESVIRTLRYLKANEWILERRSPTRRLD